MNKIFKIALMAIAITTSQVAVAAPPTIMVLPSQDWCYANGYTIENSIDEDFEKAFLDQDLNEALTVINGLMQNYNIPIVDYRPVANSRDDNDIIRELYESGQTGSGLKALPYESALENLNPDIAIRISYRKHKAGFDYSITCNLDAFDAYSNEPIASVKAQSAPAAATVPLTACIERAITDKMPDFIQRLQEYFDDIQSNGRKINVALQIIDNGSGLSFTDDYGDLDLASVIYDWMHANSVNNQFREGTSTRNILTYNLVRIPFKEANGKRTNARGFVAKLRRFLSAAPYNIPCENVSSGLGNGRLYLGEK